ncbi:3-hydroxyisobutyrate dehydrogenase [Sinosporangium album]|uniref:3-hydroxyisobutyrate dehydrogenase n=1 Tax=Sinosporangium album TaxID=504805 RepID=A0A1G7YQ14_9ACTN|nr:NAD(P)-dependent oxidoreductase [Sinosporangium album]SDG98355.1 3-hydroxyisobutyrate dehydrogenase [Sinosporangium album]
MTTPGSGPTVGLIAPGKIGLPFAANLIADGYTVWGYRRGSMADFEALGGKAAGSAKEIAERVDVIYTCVTSADALDTVISGEQGLLTAGRSDVLVVDIGAMALSRKEAARDVLAANGITMLDAPVSGTPPMVAERRAVVFASGDETQFERVRPALAALGSIVYTGAFGSGSKMKFVANTLVAVHTAVAAEAIALAKAMDLDLQQVIDRIKPSAAASTMFNVRAPMMAENRFRPVKGTVAGMVDVMDAIKATAAEAGATMPLLSATLKICEEACAQGYGEEDIASIISVLGAESIKAVTKGIETAGTAG